MYGSSPIARAYYLNMYAKMPLHPSFCWASICLDVAFGTISRDDLAKSFLLQAQSGASDFHGLGGDTQAVRQLKAALASYGLAMRLSVSRVSESDPHCLAHTLSDPEIAQVVPDIRDFVCGYMYTEQMSFTEKVRAIFAGVPSYFVRDLKAPTGFSPAAWGEPLDLGIGGIPCTDISKIGLRHCLNGKTMELWAVFAYKHRMQGTPCIIIENLQDEIVVWLIYYFFSDMYHIHYVTMDPEDVGYQLIRRTRLGFVLLKKGVVNFHLDFYAMHNCMVAELRSKTNTQPCDCLLGTKADIAEEVAEMTCSRQHLKKRLSPIRHASDYCTVRERGVIKHYMKKSHHHNMCKKNVIVYLGDDGKYLHGISDQRISTFRHSGGLYWALGHDRWVLVKEMLAAMGWPTFPHLSHAALVPIAIPKMPKSILRKKIGNSMHVANLGVLILCALLCTSWGP